ncbi:MAG: hypothetical protein NVSMB1_17780 [Polyangiales bacterium]
MTSVVLSTDSRTMASRVLVVDDSPTIRRVVGSILTQAGYEVGHAGDGAQALQALQRERYTLALIDFVMPKLNGFELCKKLRDDPDLRDLPVILMSVKADKIRDHFLRQTGALDAITKPFDPRALLLTVERALRKVEEGRSLRIESFPPTSGSEATEPTVTDPFASPILGLRGAVPEAFVTRVSEAIARLMPELDAVRTPIAVANAVRAVLGEEGVFSLYRDAVGETEKAVLSGDLSAIPLAEVLQLLQLQRQTGVIIIFNMQTEVRVFMREGLIDLATSRGTRDEFRLGRYVVEGGRIDRSQLHAILDAERASAAPRRLGDALVAAGVLTPEELEKALARQTSELIYDVLRWTSGRFVFDQRARHADADAAQLGLPVASIVMEGFRRVDEWRLMEGALGDFDQVFYRDPAAIDAMGGARLSLEESSVLSEVDGERAVRDLIGVVSMSSFDVCKILYQLVQSRLIRKRLG